MCGELPDEVKIAKELGLTDLIPEFYKDLLQPATQELGRGLLTTAQAINIALAPLEGMVWGYEKIKNYLTVSLAKRLTKIPPEKIVRPKPNIAGPIIEGFKFSGHDPNLRELFSNLLAASMDADKAEKAHPAFVEIIKQLSPDESRILFHISQLRGFPEVTTASVRIGWWNDYTHRDLLESFEWVCKDLKLDSKSLIGSYFDNLRRLQILEVSHEHKDELNDKPYRLSDIDEVNSVFNSDKERIDTLFASKLGIQFINICVRPNFSPIEEDT